MNGAVNPGHFHLNDRQFHCRSLNVVVVTPPSVHTLSARNVSLNVDGVPGGGDGVDVRYSVDALHGVAVVMAAWLPSGHRTFEWREQRESERV